MTANPNQKHPHAFVLQAIADGVPLSNFEVQHVNWTSNTWDSAESYSSWIGNPTRWKMREKQKYIVVNGFNVPRPAESVELNQKYFMAAIQDGKAYVESYTNTYLDWGNDNCKTGFVHLTKKAAFQHALALTSIDPAEAEKRGF